MSADLNALDSPEKIADAGERIYEERYKAELEPGRHGHFIAVDVTSGCGYIAEYPEQALQDAREAAPNGIFHLIRIGALRVVSLTPGSLDVLVGMDFLRRFKLGLIMTKGAIVLSDDDVP
jgi:hypothetical protein